METELAYCHALAERAIAEGKSGKTIREAREKERLFVGAQMAFVQPKGVPINKDNLRAVIESLYRQQSERTKNYEWRAIKEGHKLLEEPPILDEIKRLRARAILFMNLEQKLLGSREIGRDRV